MISVNSVTLLGEIKGDIRHNTTANSQVANASLLTEEQTFNGKTIRTYHNITVWGKSAELVRDMNEGEKLYVQGSIGTESWEQDGERKYKTVIKANRVNLVTEDGIANDPF